MIPQPPTAGFSAFEIKQALMRGAAGDHGAESGLVLLMAGDWLPELSQADLITVEICLDGCCGDGPVAKLDWAGVHAALQDGRLAGSAGEIAALRVAASLAHGLLVDLGEVAAGLDRRSIGAVQAAIAFATYDPEVRRGIISDAQDTGAAQSPGSV
ncbi:hypothetical protein GCU60_12070 [Blastococcus saxobsidens]|uniref:Uncharacterized protein n=1 Tax=Blastococcus saxobsidens TaxID=138336 RepID=A0A6L9W3A8_9ACTN|nr:hypothetical protein [Blastococcus saxobsidens]NEK86483.1 hypothetical protein [Blastococcus saxobsidens]